MSTLESILRWQQLARPAPTERDRLVAIGVHFEEFAEMCEALGLHGTALELHRIADDFKSGVRAVVVEDRGLLLDSLCDQQVTGIGVAHTLGDDILGALAEVSRSNDSKFVNGQPVFDANGKVRKGPSYSPPNLALFLGDK